MRGAENKPKNTWFWLGLAAIAIIVGTALWALYLEHKSQAMIRHAGEVKDTTDELLESSVNAESGAFGYALTRQTEFLNSYKASLIELDRKTGQLFALVRNDPGLQTQAELLQPLIHQEIEDLSQLARGIDSGSRGTAGVNALAKNGARLVEDAQRIISGIKAEEENAVARFSGAHRRRMRTGLGVLAGSGLLALSSLLLGRRAHARDASRRQRAEAGLNVSERRFQALCEQAPIGIYETDARGMCVYTNSRWSQIAGLSPAESLGHGWKKALHPDDRSFDGWQKAMMQGARWEYRLVTPQGEIRWILALGGPIHSDKGDVTGYVGTLEDITDRKQADTAVQEREALNRAILNSLAANIAVMKADGTIQAANESWLRAAQGVGEAPACWLPTGANYLKACRDAASAGSEDARMALAGIQDVLAGKRPSFEMEWAPELPQGKRWFYMLVNPLVGVSAGGAVITHVDNTERKRSREWFRLAVEAAPSGMVVFDSDGKIVLVNSRAEKLFGYRREELMNQPIGMLIPDLLGNGTRPTQAQRDLCARRKDGTRFPLEIGLNPITTDEGSYVLSSIVDITERRQAEDERQKFVSLADQSPEFIGMYDLNFKPFYVNSAGLHLVGVDSVEAARRAAFQENFFPEDQHFILNEFLPRAQRDGYGKVQIRFRHFKTGEPIWVISNMFAIYDARGAHVGWGTVSTDITERKRAEEALRESRQELRALAGRLINAEEQERKRISRELHDDLTQKLALLAFDAGGLLVSPPPSAEKVHEQLFRLRTRVVELAQDVRQISHELHPSILEDLGLSAALREFCEEFSAREGIEVLFTQEGTPEGLPMEVASCLYRVTQEALHNVRKHAQTGYVRVKVDSSANGIHLVVRDTGVGFDAEAGLRRPGLGIVSMKERVRMVQGEFSIYSRPGHGTEVRVFVPLCRTGS